MTKFILPDSLLEEVTMKGNASSNLSNTTKPIFLFSLNDNNDRFIFQVISDTSNRYQKGDTRWVTIIHFRGMLY